MVKRFVLHTLNPSIYQTSSNVLDSKSNYVLTSNLFGGYLTVQNFMIQNGQLHVSSLRKPIVQHVKFTHSVSSQLIFMAFEIQTKKKKLPSL